eukprot:GHVS01006049.1.p1 GENE.GHVS01006049.1~~GHVS01006049.1.p1  ORF type:complete len:536 (+),score=162.89 GHVS01006049.1:201-1808(+)
MSSRHGSCTAAVGKRRKWQMEARTPVASSSVEGSRLGEEEDARDERLNKGDEGGQDIEADIRELQKLMEEQKEGKRHRQKYHHKHRQRVGDEEVAGGKEGNSGDGKEENGSGFDNQCPPDETNDKDLGSGRSPSVRDEGEEQPRRKRIQTGGSLERTSEAPTQSAGTASSRSSSRSSSVSMPGRGVRERRGKGHQGTAGEGSDKQTPLVGSTGIDGKAAGDEGGKKERRRRRYDWMDSDDEDITGSSGNEEEEELLVMEAVTLRVAATTRSNADPASDGTISTGSSSSGTATTGTSTVIDPSSASSCFNGNGSIGGSGYGNFSQPSYHPPPPPTTAADDHRLYENVKCVCISNISWDGTLAQLKDFIQSCPLLPALKVIGIAKHSQHSSSTTGEAIAITNRPPPMPSSSHSRPPPPPPVFHSPSPSSSNHPRHPFVGHMAPPHPPSSSMCAAACARGASLPLFSKTDHTGRAFVEFQSYEVHTEPSLFSIFLFLRFSIFSFSSCFSSPPYLFHFSSPFHPLLVLFVSGCPRGHEA